MRYLLISVAAAAAVAGAATIAAAQDEKSKGPGVEQQAPGAGKAEKAPQKSMPQGETGRDKASSSEPRQGSDKDQPKAAQQPGTSEQPKSTQQKAPERDRPKAAQEPKADQDRPKAAEQRKPSGDDQPKSAEPTAKDRQKAADPKQEPGKDQPKAAEQAQPGKDKSAEQNKDKASGQVQVSEQQRTDIRQRLVKETRVEKTRINVTVNVGTTIPRSVRLHTLPVAIVAIAPAYRGYHYVVLEDETIVIIDPRTYVVVDLISSGGPHRAQLTLSTEDRRFIFSTLPRNRTADVRVRLALGAEVPRSVELHTFPAVVVERVPDMRRYRYIVVEDDIVVVDPNDHAVVMVIEN
jgi:hypothetical protein